jgi:kynureninase
MGVVTDFRPPDGIRVAPVALYSTFEEVWETVSRLGRVVREGRQLKYATRTSVTN